MIEDNMNIKESEDLLNYTTHELNVFQKQKEFQIDDFNQIKKQFKKSNKLEKYD